MYDSIVRNGTIIDGTGNPRFVADIAIKDGKIAKIGQITDPATNEIDAKGKLVTPGWVDIHTHYDGQATWDPLLAPSSWHGVTTVVMGNCGVGFAPVKPEDRDFLIELMEGVEDIPGAALSEGIDWQWESFPEYLDTLESIPRAIDVAAQVPHGAIRAYVMGERCNTDYAPTQAEVEEMAIIKVDLSNRDEAIKTLKVEADAAHQSMIDAVERAKVASKDLDELFAHRDFLKSEGDRFHNEFVAGKEKADEVHQKIVKMMDEVNEARDKLKMARVERESWMSDHNDSINKMMKTGAESEDVANALVDTLLDSGTLTFGGTMDGDEGRVVKRGSSRKKQMRRVDVSASRTRK